MIPTGLLPEYEAVLTRPTVLRMIGIDSAAVLAVLDELAGLCIPVVLDYRWRPSRMMTWSSKPRSAVAPA